MKIDIEINTTYDIVLGVHVASIWISHSTGNLLATVKLAAATVAFDDASRISAAISAGLRQILEEQAVTV